MKNLTVIILLLAMLTACSSKPATFYIMNPLPQKINKHSSLQVSVDTVNVASYLQKAQIVTRLSSQSLKLAEFNRWAEPLRENITSVIIENLKVILLTPYVLPYPAYTANDSNVRVVVNVTRFDTSESGMSVLNANWRLINPRTGKIIRARSIKLSKPVVFRKKSDYGAIVAAMNFNLKQLCYAIARSIRRR